MPDIIMLVVFWSIPELLDWKDQTLKVFGSRVVRGFWMPRTENENVAPLDRAREGVGFVTRIFKAFTVQVRVGFWGTALSLIQLSITV